LTNKIKKVRARKRHRRPQHQIRRDGNQGQKVLRVD